MARLLQHCRVVRSNRVARSRAVVAKFRDPAFEIFSEHLKESFALTTTTSGDSHACDNLSIDTPREVAPDPTPVFQSARSPGHEDTFPMASTGVFFFILALDADALNRCRAFSFPLDRFQ
jgi:hypothetical protein